MGEENNKIKPRQKVTKYLIRFRDTLKCVLYSWFSKISCRIHVKPFAKRNLDSVIFPREQLDQKDKPRRKAVEKAQENISARRPGYGSDIRENYTP